MKNTNIPSRKLVRKAIKEYSQSDMIHDNYNDNNNNYHCHHLYHHILLPKLYKFSEKLNSEVM